MDRVYICHDFQPVCLGIIFGGDLTVEIMICNILHVRFKLRYKLLNPCFTAKLTLSNYYVSQEFHWRRGKTNLGF